MPLDIGSQTITILFLAAANSSIVNRRFEGIRQTGIYSGGYLAIVDDSHAQISTLVCEISSGTYQVRVETDDAVNLAVAELTPYIILRWAYTGAITDYMELLAVATPAANELVVGKCNFVGGNLNGFDYQDSLYPRSTPNTQDLFLKVESTAATERRVRIRAGRIQITDAVIDITDQPSDLFDAVGSDSRIDLVYINRSTGAIEIETGVADPSPSAPDYSGKLVLAEVTLTAGYTNITASMIKDARNFLSHDEMYQDRGEFIAEDFKLSVPGSVGQLTADGAWHEADFSPVIPAGARASIFKLAVIGTDGAHSIWIKAIDASASSANFGLAYAVNDNYKMVDFEFTVKLTSSRKIQYRISVGVIDAIISCKAWFI